MTTEPLAERLADDLVLLIESTRPESLVALRSRVQRIGRQYGLGDLALPKFVLVVHELVVNVARHGGGRGEVKIWKDPTGLRCAVTDRGGGMPRAHVRDEQLAAPRLHGWGLWLVHQICLDVRVQTGGQGTCVTICYQA